MLWLTIVVQMLNVLLSDGQFGPQLNATGTEAQGTWRLLSLEYEGVTTSDLNTTKNYYAEMRFVFGNDSLIIRGKSVLLPMEYRLTLRPKQEPKEIDVVCNGLGTWKGIYEVKGDKMSLCIGDSEGHDRPKEFKTQAGSGLRLLLLERVKR